MEIGFFFIIFSFSEDFHQNMENEFYLNDFPFLFYKTLN